MSKKLIPYIAAAAIAVGSFFSGAVTNAGDALKLALDKEGLVVACEKLVRGDKEAADSVAEAASE